MEGGISSTRRMMQQQPYCTRTPTTHQLTGGEETVMKPVSIWGWMIRRP